MSSPSDAASQYPAVCPSCDESKGFPYQVKTLSDPPGSIEVRVRCRDCLHEWAEVVTSHA